MKKILLFILSSLIVTLTFGQGTPIRYAPIASPHLTGTPLAPTPSTADNSTKIATTAFTQSLFTNNAIYFGTGLFTGSGTSGSPFILNTGSNYSWAVIQQFLANGIAATPTDILQVGNSTLSTSGVPVQESGGLNFQNHTWNTGGTPADNIANMRMYTRGSSGAAIINTFVIDASINGGSYANVFSLNSIGQMAVGQATVSSLITGQTLITKPGAGTAVNTTATVTAANVATQLFTSTTAAAVTATLPSANSILTSLNGATGTISRLVVINTGPNTFTIALPATITSVSAVTGGTNLVVAAAGAVPTTAVFELVWATTTAAIIYRLQ